MKIIDLAIEAAQKAGKLILKEKKEKFKIEKKGVRDLVTSVDKASEKLIIETIKKIYPNHAFLGEESSFESKEKMQNLASAEYIWIIDPIDGTTNFVHGLKNYAISIAAFKTSKKEKSKNFDYLEGEIIAGVVYSPELKELYHAEKGKGAFLNGEPIKVSKQKKLINSLAATGFPAREKEVNLPHLLAMLKEARAIRRFGAASLDLAKIAAGHFDLFWEFGLKPWDIAAGVLLIHEAGGQVSDIYGETLDLFGKNILATNGKLTNEVLKVFKNMEEELNNLHS